MNELQLYISKSTREFRTLVEINGEENVRLQITDMREIVEAVNYPSESKSLFYAVNYVKGGYMIHVLRTIPPTSGNHLDATIYIDSAIDIMAEDLEEVIDTVSEKVLAASVTEEDMRQLRELFAREYDSRDKVPKIKPSQGDRIARINYGRDRSLYDIIEEGLYRKAWSGYKTVLIINDDIPTTGESVIDLDEPNDATDIAAHKYLFALPMETPDGRSMLEFEVECSKNITRSPIAGYDIKGQIEEGDNNVNNLRRANSDVRAFFIKLLWAFGGLVAGLLTAAIIGLFSGHEVNDKKESLQQTSVVENPSKDTEASYYLDSHRVWQRDNMEKIEALKGLYDDLNNYRYDRLTGHWAAQLRASKNFSKIVKAAQKAQNKKVDPRRDAEHDPTYNKESDSSISWLGYTYWIDP